MSEALQAIEPNLCPGGVVARVYTDHQLFLERKLDGGGGDEIAFVGTLDSDAAFAAAQVMIEILIYDGDTGAPFATHRLLKHGADWVDVGTWVNPAFDDRIDA